MVIEKRRDHRLSLEIAKNCANEEESRGKQQRRMRTGSGEIRGSLENMVKERHNCAVIPRVMERRNNELVFRVHYWSVSQGPFQFVGCMCGLNRDWRHIAESWEVQKKKKDLSEMLQ